MKIHFLLLLFIDVVYTSKILFVNTWHSKSHARTMLPLAERLQDRGHDVSMYSQVSSSIGKMGNKINTIESIVPKDNITDDQRMISSLFWTNEMAPKLFEKPFEIGRQYMQFLMDDETFIKLTEDCYDLVIVDEMFSVVQTSLATHFKRKCGAKVAVFLTTDLAPVFSHMRGLGRNPVVAANYYTKGYSMFDFDWTRFSERLLSFTDAFVENFILKYWSSKYITEGGNLMGLKDQTINTLIKESYLTFVDYPVRYGLPLSRTNEVIYAGEHCEIPKPLSTDYLKFIEDKTSKGTIYIAFGSIVDWVNGPPEVIDVFVTVLNQLTDYRFIWSYTGKPLPKLGKHVMLTKWAPQNDVLHHEKVILFFTHGGLKSLKESICSKTRMLLLPFFADQPKNALYAMHMNIAEAIYKKNITVTEMSSKMKRAIENHQLKTNMDKLSSHFLDHIVPPLDLGAFWVEKVMRMSEKHKNLMSIYSKTMTFFTFLQCDLIFILFSLIVVMYK